MRQKHQDTPTAFIIHKSNQASAVRSALTQLGIDFEEIPDTGSLTAVLKTIKEHQSTPNQMTTLPPTLSGQTLPLLSLEQRLKGAITDTSPNKQIALYNLRAMTLGCGIPLLIIAIALLLTLILEH